MRLKIVSGPEVVGPYSLLDGPNLAGRDPICRIYLPGREVSRQHAVVHVEQGRVRVDDLGTTNGLVDMQGRRSASLWLSNGERLRLGEYVVELDDEQETMEEDALELEDEDEELELEERTATRTTRPLVPPPAPSPWTTGPAPAPTLIPPPGGDFDTETEISLSEETSDLALDPEHTMTRSSRPLAPPPAPPPLPGSSPTPPRGPSASPSTVAPTTPRSSIPPAVTARPSRSSPVAPRSPASPGAARPAASSPETATRPAPPPVVQPTRPTAAPPVASSAAAPVTPSPVAPSPGARSPMVAPVAPSSVAPSPVAPSSVAAPVAPSPVAPSPVASSPVASSPVASPVPLPPTVSAAIAAPPRPTLPATPSSNAPRTPLPIPATPQGLPRLDGRASASRPIAIGPSLPAVPSENSPRPSVSRLVPRAEVAPAATPASPVLAAEEDLGPTGFSWILQLVALALLLVAGNLMAPWAGAFNLLDHATQGMESLAAERGNVIAVGLAAANAQRMSAGKPPSVDPFDNLAGVQEAYVLDPNHKVLLPESEMGTSLQQEESWVEQPIREGGKTLGYVVIAYDPREVSGKYWSPLLYVAAVIATGFVQLLLLGGVGWWLVVRPWTRLASDLDRSGKLASPAAFGAMEKVVRWINRRRE